MKQGKAQRIPGYRKETNKEERSVKQTWRENMAVVAVVGTDLRVKVNTIIFTYKLQTLREAHI